MICFMRPVIGGSPLLAKVFIPLEAPLLHLLICVLDLMIVVFEEIAAASSLLDLMLLLFDVGRGSLVVCFKHTTSEQ